MIKSPMARVQFWVLGLLVCGLVSGCGKSHPPAYPVQGKFVFEDGTTPMFGDVEFYNADLKLNARGKISRDGTFTVSTFGEDDGAVAGKHQVVILQFVSSQLIPQHIGSQIEHDHGDLVATQYGDYLTSDLACTVKPQSENKIELVLKKKR